MLTENTCAESAHINNLIVEENRIAWHSKSNSALQIFFEDALHLAQAVSAPENLCHALEDYVALLQRSESHALDGTDRDMEI
jgi:hypothetical protein